MFLINYKLLRPPIRVSPTGKRRILHPRARRRYHQAETPHRSTYRLIYSTQTVDPILTVLPVIQPPNTTYLTPPRMTTATIRESVLKPTDIQTIPWLALPQIFTIIYDNSRSEVTLSFAIDKHLQNIQDLRNARLQNSLPPHFHYLKRLLDRAIRQGTENTDRLCLSFICDIEIDKISTKLSTARATKSQLSTNLLSQLSSFVQALELDTPEPASVNFPPEHLLIINKLKAQIMIYIKASFIARQEKHKKALAAKQAKQDSKLMKDSEILTLTRKELQNSVRKILFNSLPNRLARTNQRPSPPRTRERRNPPKRRHPAAPRITPKNGFGRRMAPSHPAAADTLRRPRSTTAAANTRRPRINTATAPRRYPQESRR